jgi:hypothetical protein
MLAAASVSVGDCSPNPGSEIEIRRPIPLSCKAPEGVVKAVLAYKEFGGTQFVNVPMSLADGQFRSPIPCSATKMEGALLYVVVMKDASGNTVSSVGTLDQPAQLNIVKATTQPPPAFPGEPPPARCAEEVECPPGMPGCTPSGGGGWGDSCTPADQCKKGLYCASGTCENAPTCETDSDCDSGRCSEGFCEMGDSSSSSGGGKIRKLWLGLHGAFDLHFFDTANDVCGINSIGNHKYACYYKGTTTPIRSGTDPNSTTYDVPPEKRGEAGRIGGGAKVATIRLMVSGDYAVIPNLSVGARLGFAFNGGPKGANYKSADGKIVESGKAFLPIHAEGRVTWWIRSLGQPGIHPYVAVGGGLAQVDAKITVPVRADGVNPYQVDVYRRLGQGFITLAPGAVFPITPTIGVQGNINLMRMLPVSGWVLEPSLGVVMGL